MKIAKLIDKLGGVSTVAGELSNLAGKPVSSGTVYRWRDRDTVSFRWRPLVAQLAANKGVKLPADLAMFQPRGSAE